jgi:hypothetical protein
MNAKYEAGQVVKTVTGEKAEIFRIEEFGTSIFYECWISGRGMLMVHETKLVSR